MELDEFIGQLSEGPDARTELQGWLRPEASPPSSYAKIPTWNWAAGGRNILYNFCDGVTAVWQHGFKP